MIPIFILVSSVSGTGGHPIIYDVGSLSLTTIIHGTPSHYTHTPPKPLPPTMYVSGPCRTQSVLARGFTIGPTLDYPLVLFEPPSSASQRLGPLTDLDLPSLIYHSSSVTFHTTSTSILPSCLTSLLSLRSLNFVSVQVQLQSLRLEMGFSLSSVELS